MKTPLFKKKRLQVARPLAPRSPGRFSGLMRPKLNFLALAQITTFGRIPTLLIKHVKHGGGGGGTVTSCCGDAFHY